MALTVGTARSGLDTAFRQRYGRAPAGTWSAPGRVNLIGEHTDYNGGLGLPVALPLYISVAAAPLTEPVLELASAQTGHAPVQVDLATLRPGSVTGWAAYPAGVAWALAEGGYDLGGTSMLFDSTLPSGAGLSSSAALECATALALAALHRLTIDRLGLARSARRAENDFVGVPCGIMDQAASLLCRADHALLVDARDLTFEHVPLPTGDTELLVIDTQVARRLASGGYGDRRASCQRAAALLGLECLRDISTETLGDQELDLLGPTLARRVGHVITENARVVACVEALRAGDLPAAGRSLSQSHASLRDDFEVSWPEADLAVQAALDGGAYGARMTGGGFGGCVVALVPPGADVAGAVARAFAAGSLRPPRAFDVRPSGPAKRIGVSSRRG